MQVGSFYFDLQNQYLYLLLLVCLQAYFQLHITAAAAAADSQH